MVKTVYLLLAFPFFALTLLPFLNTVFLHTRPTGYNPHGKTVPMAAGEVWDYEKGCPKPPEKKPSAAASASASAPSSTASLGEREKTSL